MKELNEKRRYLETKGPKEIKEESIYLKYTEILLNIWNKRGIHRPIRRYPLGI